MLGEQSHMVLADVVLPVENIVKAGQGSQKSLLYCRDLHNYQDNFEVDLRYMIL